MSMPPAPRGTVMYLIHNGLFVIVDNLPQLCQKCGQLKPLIRLIMNPLDLIPDDVLYEQYSEPLGGVTTLAKMYGVGAMTVWGRLNRNPVRFMDAQATKAFRLHELAVAALYEKPAIIYDKDGNERIDPSSVALLKYRSSEASRIAGILYSKLSERHQIDVTHTASPLADMLQRIAAQGSTIPIAAPITIEGELVERTDNDDPADGADDTGGPALLG